MDTIGGPSLICGQQSAGASSEDNKGPNMGKGQLVLTYRGIILLNFDFLNEIQSHSYSVVLTMCFKSSPLEKNCNREVLGIEA